MALIIVEKGHSEDKGQRYSLSEGTTLIGRETPENHPGIALHDEFVSRRHAEICFKNNSYQLRDLLSTNGTSLNGLPLAPNKFYPLRHDAEIGLGLNPSGARVILRFKSSPTVTTSRIAATEEAAKIKLEWLRIDEKSNDVRVDGKQLVLSRKEYDLILCLYRKAGQVCGREELISGVWPEAVSSEGVTDSAIDQLVHRLRQKIEQDPAQPRRLIIKKGFGYYLC